mmetsp:Transcript_14922/g.43076  ORF Transcript_14922/g.43076 Transcript_14922/m.43076 type:complete len:203 (+) Transcript_14922:39-647(+)
MVMILVLRFQSRTFHLNPMSSSWAIRSSVIEDVLPSWRRRYCLRCVFTQIASCLFGLYRCGTRQSPCFSSYAASSLNLWSQASSSTCAPDKSTFHLNPIPSSFSIRFFVIRDFLPSLKRRYSLRCVSTHNFSCLFRSRLFGTRQSPYFSLYAASSSNLRSQASSSTCAPVKCEASQTKPISSSLSIRSPVIGDFLPFWRRRY